MTLAEFYIELKERFNDPQGALFSDGRLRELINKAFRKIWIVLNANRIYLKKETATLTFIADSQEIEIPLVDFRYPYKLIMVANSDGERLEIREEEFSKRSAENESVYFKSVVSTDLDPSGGGGFLRKYYLGWHNSPTSSFDLTIVYNAQIQLYTLNDSVNKTIHDIPPQFHDVVLDCATYLGWSTRGIRQEVLDTIQFWKSEYEEGLSSMVATLGLDGVTQQSVVDVYASD